MRVILFFILLILVSCASEPVRTIASEAIVFGEAVAQKSGVKFISPQRSGSLINHNIYMFFKDANDLPVDFDPAHLKARNKMGQELPVKLNRLLRGHYYASIEQQAEASALLVDFYINGNKFKDTAVLNNRQASKNHSSLTLVKIDGSRLLMRLQLRDEKGQQVVLSNTPEILVSGNQTIEDMKPVKDGNWEFCVRMPGENHIMYLSVRADGIDLSNIFRYQHIEK